MPVDDNLNNDLVNNDDHEDDHNVEQINPEGGINYQRYDQRSGTDRNVLTSANVRQSCVSANLDEEVIRQRGKRLRTSYHVMTRSMNPIVLALRKSPIKRPRDNSVTYEMLKILGHIKSPNKRTPVKRLQRTPPSPSSPGMRTRKRLNMSCDSGIGSPSPSPSSSPTSSSGTRGSTNNKKNQTKPQKRTQRSRRDCRRNLRRLS